MGTSQSNGGPGGGVPLVPPWVPDIEPPGVPRNPVELPVAPATPNPVPQPAQLAPSGRFNGTRRSLGSFARSGSEREMRRGLGHYSRSGYGGTGNATRRMGGTSATAGALYRALGGGSGRGSAAAADGVFDPAVLAGRSAEEVMNAVVDAVRPIDGTLDAEASRAAVVDALSELLTRYPDADLLNLTDDQRALAVERYTANDVFRRIDLDVGQSIREKAQTASSALSRLKQVRDYVRETVAVSFRRLREAGRTLTAGRVEQFVRDAIQETFEVFEGFAE
ncbi:MAG: hypothetical protein A49_02290 [Methyloceanibacter sp.]|nr:MAG: hypothetical protein A49_02290 [Methyloceanibacter sp.]